MLLLDSRFGPSDVWQELPAEVQSRIIEKQLSLWVIDAQSVARATGMGGHTNTIMQTCFFAISGVLPREMAIAKIRGAIEKSYGSKGVDVVRKNFAAVEQTLANLHQVKVPTCVTSKLRRLPAVPDGVPSFVQAVTARMMEGRGDEIPVSALPNDGTYPSGTARYEKRGISAFVPEWEPDLCIQCGDCAFVCPHGVIRSKFYPEARLELAPPSFKNAPINGNRSGPPLSFGRCRGTRSP